MEKNKAIVFDRDGTLINYIPYLHQPKDVKLIDGVSEVLKLLKSKGFKLFLHTNQSGVGRGYYSLEDVEKCNNEMLRLINLGNDLFEKICIAEDFPPLKDTYRKPSPKFGNEILNEYQIDRSNLVYIGDNISDLETAKNIGCRGFGVNYGTPDLLTKIKARDDIDYPILNNLLEFSDKLIIE